MNARQSSVLMNTKVAKQAFGKHKTRSVLPEGQEQRGFCEAKPSERVQHTIHKGYKFATTIADLTHHRVYDVIEGKSRNLVESKLMSYKGRDKVKVVCMDLSSSYRSIVRRCFPKAKIVADRFHVIRLVLYHFMEF